MNNTYSLWSIRGLLFVFDIENAKDVAREGIIVSKDVNDDKELAELFDILLRPEFFHYSEKERVSLIETLAYFLEKNDSFDGVFSKMDTYFDEGVKDQRQFMKVLLERLRFYQSESKGV